MIDMNIENNLPWTWGKVYAGTMSDMSSWKKTGAELSSGYRDHKRNNGEFMLGSDGHVVSGSIKSEGTHIYIYIYVYIYMYI